MAEDMNLLRRRITGLEAREAEVEKENNILITGLDIQDEEECKMNEKIHEFIMQSVSVDAKIWRVYKVRDTWWYFKMYVRIWRLRIVLGEQQKILLKQRISNKNGFDMEWKWR